MKQPKTYTCPHCSREFTRKQRTLPTHYRQGEGPTLEFWCPGSRQPGLPSEASA